MHQRRIVSYDTLDSTFGEQVFDIPIAETEAIVEPNGMADDFLGKPTAMMERSLGFHPSSVANRR